ncbi:MAG: hypothetical protein RLP15_05605 [Cryomorphaceae bacterium]
MTISATEHTIQVQKTARYYVLEPRGTHVADMLVIHGYRQLGKYFIARFDSLAEMGVRVIAPEGLHRFYIEGYDGRVGASWMTKEARLADIEDYIAYLNQVYQSIGLGDKPLHLLGFSQGGPTACRWMAASGVPISSLILHSTVFPNDFDFETQKNRFTRIPSYAVFGSNDPFASEKTIATKMGWMRKKGIAPTLLRFEGGHELHLESIHLIISHLNQVG